MRKLTVAWVVLFCSCNLRSEAQKGLNSIYSAFGIGDYKMRDPNAYSGMGNAGVALPSLYTINEMNPASFGWLGKDRFLLEVGLAGLSTKYSNERENISAGDFTISRIALGMQVVNPVRTVIGLRRFSQVEYYTTANRDVAGTYDKIESQVEGSGGLYQVYMGNSFVIKKKLSLGISTGFVFGSVNSQETVLLSESDILVAESNKYYYSGTINTGIQYQFNTGKNKWMAGAFFQPQVRLNTQDDAQLKNGSDQVISAAETVNGKFTFPVEYGAGITWMKNNFTLTADVIRHDWAATGYKGNDFITTNATSYAVGVRHQFMREGIWGTSQGISLQCGFNREESYLVIRGAQLISNAATFGVTFPNKTNANYYTVGLKVGSRGRPVYPLVREDFIEFHFNLSFNSVFLKGSKYD